MFKTLLKKQMLEIFKNFFYDSRKGKNRSKKGAILYIVFYALLMFGYLGGLFGFLAHSLANPLVSVDMGWLYFIIMGGNVNILSANSKKIINRYGERVYPVYVNEDNFEKQIVTEKGSYTYKAQRDKSLDALCVYLPKKYVDEQTHRA